MKTNLLRLAFALCALLFYSTSYGQGFSAVWNTSQPGSSAGNEITIPTNSAFTYNFSIDWGDGSTDVNVTGNITHAYTAAGIYTVEITGDFPAIYFNNTGDRQKIIEILSWGNIEWESMENAFFGCENLNFDAIDNPDLSRVTSLKNMFRNASSFNGIVNSWNIGSITDISGIFFDADIFNRPLDNWNTISVTDMSDVFNGAGLFNEPLDSWNTTSVTTMARMFRRASSFNQNISNWNTANVTDMSGMFQSANSFVFSVDGWNVSSVLDMSRMFESSPYNSPLISWDVSNVTNMSSMFAGNSLFNQSIDGWDVSSVTDMSSMFYRATTFNQPLNNWNVSNVTNMSSMFDGFILDMDFNQPLTTWNVSNVTDMSFMFRDAANFDQPIDNWNVSSVTAMNSMFQGASVFNQPLNNWDVQNVTDMNNMFRDALAFNQSLDNWNVSTVTSMASMFEGATAFNQPLNSWDVSSVTNMLRMFINTASFNQPLNSWNVGQVENMLEMFLNADVFDQNLANWNISNVTDMSNMLSNSALSETNYDNTLIGWAAQTVSDGVSLGANGLTYCDGRDGRQQLIDTSNWNITGDTINCSFVVCTEILSPRDGDTSVPSNFNLRWAPAPSATGYRVSVRRENGATVEVILDNDDVGDVVAIDFTNDFTPGDTVYVQVIPYNDEGPATGCVEESFTIVESWNNSPDAFKLTFDTSITSTSSTLANQLRIETNNGFTYNFSIDWGDGEYNNNVSGEITHTYLVPGIYTISIIGTYPTHYYSSPNRDNIKLLTIDQWGTIAWESMQSSFYSCRSFTGYIATDTPDLSGVTDMSRMFESSNFNGNINNWDVSNVTNMSRTFIGMSDFNQPLNDWNVSNVTTMRDMFLGTPLFNQPLDNWNVSSVTDMARMFDGFNIDMAFNQSLNTWNVSNVTNMTTMFRKCVDFDQPLNNWDVSNVSSMQGMFQEARAFNQNIDSWIVTSALNMADMFFRANAFNQPLNSWNVSSVQNMANMFDEATVFNQPLSNWDVSSVNMMSGMFQRAFAFDQDLNTWDVAFVTNMSNMFDSASMYNQPMDNWSVSRVTDMNSMFNNAISFNQPLNSWDVNSVVNMSSMFEGAILFNQPLDNWDVSAVANMSSMFKNAQVFDQDISSWDVSSVTLMNSMFEEAIAFNSPMNTWDVASVTRMDLMFKNATTFDNPLQNWDTGEVLTMEEMFSGASSFNQLIDAWDVSFVTTMLAMFQNATSYNQTMNSWNVASVRTMERMFSGATSFNGEIDSWNVRGVLTMQEMFDGASLFNQTINSWRVRGVENMSSMFRNAVTFNQSLDRWDLGLVTMQSMFTDASVFDQYLGDWDVSNVSNMTNMLDNTALTRTNYDNTLIAWSDQTLTSGITLGALGLPYCDALEERQSIIDNFGWNIVGDILDCPIPECTQLASPLNGAIDIPVNTNLTWDPALFARGYRLTVRVDPGNITLVNNVTVNDTFYEFASDFSGGETVYVTLIPFNDEGDAVGPCIEESFIITTNATPQLPECTNLTTPINNANDVVVNTDLEWNPVSNADGYRLNVTDTSNGSVIVNNIDVNNDLSFEFSNDLDEDTTYEVIITPYNAEGDAISCSTEEFTTQIIPRPPTCTALISPLNGATDVDVSTNLTWTPIADATGYLVIVGITRDGIEVANNIDVGLDTFYNFGDVLRENTTHYVTIIPYNEEGDATACIEESFRTAAIPTVPGCTNLTSPLADATDVAVDTNLAWSPVMDATGYRITVVNTNTSNTIVDNEDVTTSTTYDFASDLDEDTIYEVTITPYNAVGDAMNCTTEQFTTEIVNVPTVPGCTNLTSPLADATNVVVDTNLAWSPVTDATGYRVTVANTNTTTTIVDNEDVNANTSYNFAFDLDEDTVYSVTITPYNAVGDAMNCTAEQFTTEIVNVPTVPVCTNLTSPLANATGVALDTNLAWSAVSNATGYRITVVNTNTTNTIIDNEDVTTSTTYDFASDLDEDTIYEVTITPYNAVGDAISCATEQFTTAVINVPAVPDCTQLISPEDQDTDVAITTNLEWDEVATATGYQVFVGTSTGGSDIVNADEVTTTNYNFSNDLTEGITYFVRIIPFNDTGNAAGCAEVSFTTILTEEVNEDFLPDIKFGLSPDGDGINEFWNIDGIEEYPNNTVEIYNRWNDLVFQINNYDNGRNVFRGVANKATSLGAGDLPEGTYFFNIIVNEGSATQTKTGFVVLKR
ncbi:BspA family leucine-rich repeat surface protein [Spongiivirga citrea]|uniref:BspA family leucine-rich repeat surface protein n=1 Tax=Spongiivirga citrea TaxID=1481457 RepID=A0A6M0CJ56_9FLAO|nr:BspA family leucine-rich repeat surface protein [Spongiivirga citrea]NER17966.1 BspA family leucine-rich repeat surface protein [Spongiivirga citrea]